MGASLNGFQVVLPCPCVHPQKSVPPSMGASQSSVNESSKIISATVGPSAPTQEPSMRVKDFPRRLNKGRARKEIKFFPQRPCKTAKREKQNYRTTFWWCGVLTDKKNFQRRPCKEGSRRKGTFISEDSRWRKPGKKRKFCRGGQRCWVLLLGGWVLGCVVGRCVSRYLVSG